MRLWSRWVEATSATESGLSLALFRIGIGLCVLLTIGSVVWADLVGVFWVDAAHGGVRTLKGNGLVQLLGGPEPRVIWGLVWTSLLAGVAVTVGLGGRLAAALALVTVQALVDINSYAGGSYDQLLQNALWLLVITPSAHTLSVDRRLTDGRWTTELPIGAWARWLVAFQLVLVYTSTGMQKLSAYWTPGGDFSALYYILQQPGWQHGDMRWLAPLFPLTQLATALTWFWEVLNPLWLVALWFAEDPSKTGWLRTWFRRLRVRWVFFGLGVLFHVLILATMNVGPFGPISLAFYAAMVRPDEWRALATRFSAFFGSPAAEQA